MQSLYRRNIQSSHKICLKCGTKFVANHFNTKYCSYKCKRIIKSHINLKIEHKKRGYAGYGFNKCIICDKKFKRKNYNQKSCSDICRKIMHDERKNRLQKLKHSRDKKNPNYVLSRLLRTCLTNIIAQKILSFKNYRSHRYCNYTTKEFIIHIECLFLDGMRWDNWGKWHIDHIKPLSKFNLVNKDGSENLEEIIAANSLNNLQPLWAKDNLKKNNRWEQ